MSSPALRARAGVLGKALRLPALGSLGALSGALGLLLVFAALAAEGGLKLGRVTTVEIMVVLVGAAAVAMAALFAPVPRRSWGALTAGLLALLAIFTALSITWSITPDASWVQANLLFAYVAVFCGAVAFARAAPGRWPSLLRAVLIASVALAAFGLITKVLPGVFAEDELRSRLREPFGYANAVGLMAALGVPACLWLGTRREGSDRARALAYPALSLLVLTVLLSYSRGALFAAAAAAVLWMLLVPALRLRAAGLLATAGIGAGLVALFVFLSSSLSDDKMPLDDRIAGGRWLGLLLLLLVGGLYAAGLTFERKSEEFELQPTARAKAEKGILYTLYASPVIVLLALALAGGGIGKSVSSLTDPNAKEPANTPTRLSSTGSVRARYWSEAIEVWKVRPLVGAGADGFAVGRTRFRKAPLEVQRAHGFIPQTMADLGLIGLFLSLGALAAWLFAAARTTGLRKRDQGVPMTPERVGLITLGLTVVVFGVHSFVDWTWLIPGTAIVALLCAGFVAGRGPQDDNPATRRIDRITPLRLGAASGVMLMALAACWAIWQPKRSESAATAAGTALSERKFDEAREATLTARDRNPLSIQPLLRLADIEEAAGRQTAARRALETAVRLQPANAATWGELGEFERRVNRLEPALAALRAALFLDPRSERAQARFLIGLRQLGAENARRAGGAPPPAAPPAATPPAGATAPAPGKPTPAPAPGKPTPAPAPGKPTPAPAPAPKP